MLLILTKQKAKYDQNTIFNLSPNIKKQVNVKKIIELIIKNTSIKRIKIKKVANIIKEKKYLHISSNKAQKELGWKTKLDLKIALKLTIDFYLLSKTKTFNEAIKQINQYFIKIK